MYSFRYHTLTQALALSFNSAAARLCYEVGHERVAAVARRLGIKSPIAANPTIALGTSEVTLLEMASAYAAIANGGYRVTPYLVTTVADQDGRVVFRHAATAARQRVVGQREVDAMTMMLRQVVERGTATRGFVPGYDMAGKSGTTQADRIGFGGPLTTAVWLGNMDGQPMRSVSGGTLPAAIFADFMRKALSQKPPPSRR